jgi:hypothetical protein
MDLRAVLVHGHGRSLIARRVDVYCKLGVALAGPHLREDSQTFGPDRQRAVDGSAPNY